MKPENGFTGQLVNKTWKIGAEYAKSAICKEGSDGEKISVTYNHTDMSTPFERIQIDILDPLPTNSFGNKYLLVIVDCFYQMGGKLSVERY